MTSTAAATSVSLDITVDVPTETAFRLFTENFDQVKPREYNLLSAPIEHTVFEPHVGGHIYDRGTDGSICRWARVLAFDPPERVVFTWDIDPRWQLETDPERASEVEVRFVAEGEGRTRVLLEHRLWEARQTIHDPAGDHDWVIEAIVDLDASDEAGEPVVLTSEMRRL